MDINSADKVRNGAAQIIFSAISMKVNPYLNN